MNKVYLLCGQVASGKSTYARTLAEREGALILSGDELLLKLEDRCQGPAHQREMEERIQAYFLTLILQLQKLDVPCVLDHGYWYADARAQVLRFCADHHIPCEVIWVRCHEQTRKEWLQARNARLSAEPGRHYLIDEEMLARFDRWFEPPQDAHILWSDAHDAGR